LCMIFKLSNSPFSLLHQDCLVGRVAPVLMFHPPNHIHAYHLQHLPFHHENLLDLLLLRFQGIPALPK
jgi:hypothetical protein